MWHEDRVSFKPLHALMQDKEDAAVFTDRSILDLQTGKALAPAVTVDLDSTVTVEFLDERPVDSLCTLGLGQTTNVDCSGCSLRIDRLPLVCHQGRADAGSPETAFEDAGLMAREETTRQPRDR